MNPDLDAWFEREILVHEPALMRFLHRHWHDRDEIADLRQDVYVRVYDAAAHSRPTSPKSFLFTVTRNLLADRVRRQHVVSITVMGDLDELNVLIDELEPSRWAAGRERLRRLAEVIDRLPTRCREVVWLRRVEDLPQKEIARRLGISEKTVEKHIAKGSRLLAARFHAPAPDAAANHGMADNNLRSDRTT